MKNIQITQWCSHFIEQQVLPGDLCIDATMGNGHDTLLLSDLVGEKGIVHGFDIQKEALSHTEELLKKNASFSNYHLHLCSHTRMNEFVEESTVSCIVFNFGYLPGGDHTLATQSDSSIEALESSLRLLKKNGLLSLCIYSGGDTGFSERDAILQWLRQLNPKKYLVILSEYYNRPNHPPIPAIVVRL